MDNVYWYSDRDNLYRSVAYRTDYSNRVVKIEYVSSIMTRDISNISSMVGAIYCVRNGYCLPYYMRQLITGDFTPFQALAIPEREYSVYLLRKMK